MDTQTLVDQLCEDSRYRLEYQPSRYRRMMRDNQRNPSSQFSTMMMMMMMF